MFKINKGLPVWRMLSLIGVLVFGILTILGTGGEEALVDPFDIADAGPDQHVRVNETVYLDGIGSNTALGADPGDNTVIYNWEMVKKPDGAPLSGIGAATWESATDVINPAFLSGFYPGEYIIQLTVRHNGHFGSDIVKINAYLDRADTLPIARAGADIVVKHGELVELDASNSFHNSFIKLDSWYKRLTYSWYMVESPWTSTSALSSTDVVNPSFIAQFKANDMQAGNSHYKVGLRVINRSGLVSTPDFVNVYVYPSEGYAHPTPIAGPDQRVSTGTQVDLDGSESFDVDGRPLSYNWQFYSRPLGSRTVLFNANTPTPFFLPDVDGAYVLFLSVDNGEYNSISYFDETGGIPPDKYDQQYQDRVRVIASISTPEPVAILGPDQRIPYAGPDGLIMDASRSTPVINGSSTYSWGLIDIPATSNAAIVISDDSDPNGAQLNYDMQGDYVVRMKVKEVGPYEFDTIIYKVSSNTPPVADAGADQDVTANSLVTLNGSNSSDVDLDPVAYSWSLVSTPVDWTVWPGQWPLLSEGRDANPTFTPTLNGEYQLRLTVNDRELSSVADEVLINVTGAAENGVPTADAGVDQSVTVGDTVLLDGAGSSDPDNDPLSYNWTIEIRPLGSSAAIGDPSSETPSFVADVEGSYDVQLIVNDGLVNSASNTMKVTAAVAEACANPLTLMTGLPFAPNMGEIATNIQVDAQGVDTLSAIAALTTVDENVYRASIPDANNLDQAAFIVYGSNWEEISRTHTNPISDTASPSFVVRNIADDIYYKLDVDFTGTNNLEVQIDTLSGCRCGSNAGDCP